MSEEFTYQDDTVVETNGTENDETMKYTKVDCLDEDPELRGQKYALMSFISPEGIMNCKVRGIKVRGVYASESEAKAACEKLKKVDKYFDIFVGEVGKWLPWNPSTKQVEKVVHRNKKLDKIMQNVHKSEMNEMSQLNELVGRRKEVLDRGTREHKERIRNTVNESAKAYDNDTAVKTLEKTNDEKPKNTPVKNPETVRDRLRKQIEEREKRRTEELQNERKEEEKRVQIEQSENLSKPESRPEPEKSDLPNDRVKLDEKINSLKEYYEKNKVRKSEN